MRYLFQSERMAKVTGSLSVQPSLFDMFFEEFLSQVEHFTFYFLRSFTFCVLLLLISNVFLQEFFSLSSEPRPHFPVSEVFHGFSLQHYLFYPTSLFFKFFCIFFLIHLILAVYGKRRFCRSFAGIPSTPHRFGESRSA